MAGKTLSQVIGGGAGFRLAPDLNYPQNKLIGGLFISVSGIDATGSLTTLLSLTGKFSIHNLWCSLLTIDDISTVKLTVDGAVIWNVDPLTNSATEVFIGGNMISHLSLFDSLICETSFLFEMQTDVDANMTLNYFIRPIA